MGRLGGNAFIAWSAPSPSPLLARSPLRERRHQPILIAVKVRFQHPRKPFEMVGHQVLTRANLKNTIFRQVRNGNADRTNDINSVGTRRK
jgi:hypothetical protein